MNHIETLYTRLEASFKANSDNKLCELFWSKINTIYMMENKGDVITEALKLMSRHMQWMYHFNIIDWKELADWFDDHTLQRCGIYINQNEIKVNDDIVTVIDTDVVATGHSHVTAFGKSKVKAYDTTHVVAFNDVDVAAKDCSVTAFDKVTVRVKGYGKLEAFDAVNGIVSGYSMAIQNDRSVISVNSKSFLVDRRK